jgi:integrase
MPSWRLTRLKGEFCLTWDDERGVRRRYRLGTSDAKEAYTRAQAQFAIVSKPKGTTVTELWNAYTHAKEGKAVIATMKHTWKAIQGRFAEMDGRNIHVNDCRAHIKARRDAGISDGTIHTELGHLRMVLTWAVKERLIEHAPSIERPPKPDPKDYWITKAEAKKLWDCAKVPHVRLAIRLLIATGARNAAGMELTWDRVDMDRRIIKLRNPFDRATRKGRATVPINDQLYEELAEAKKAALSPFVIEWAGEPVKSVKRGLKAAGIAAGLPEISPHVLRHSAAVWMAQDGHSMDEIAQFLGHSDSRVTQKVYARFSPEHLRRVAKSTEF